MNDLTGLAVLVTGAASGIGRASAQAFVAAGARVAAVDVDRPGLTALAEGSPGQLVPIEADVRDPEQVASMVATAVDALGGLDVAHNNAGVPGPYRPLWEYSEDEFAAVLAVDLVGVWRCVKFEARYMVGSGRGGCIVNTSSMLGEVGMPDNAAYTAAKHGVHGLTRSAALELAPHGVRVNAVAPGVTRTGMTSDVSDELLADVPLRRIAEPEEIAQAVLWLAGCRYATGTVVVVDGGYTAR